MEKTLCELFAGVGGFRCGLNGITSLEDVGKEEKWDTVWFSQWEPAEKSTQYAHDCYVYHFGTTPDINGNDTTNYNIEDVDKNTIPDFNLLVGGFPCQDYSVASSLATSKGLEGKKGILWWSIRETLEAKKPPFVLLENVDRLVKSPAGQRGRDFGIILACFRDEGYTVEWRIINAAEYGYQQRRRRTFIFAYRDDTDYSVRVCENVGYSRQDPLEKRMVCVQKILCDTGFFAETFAVNEVDSKKLSVKILPEGIGKLSDSFSFKFENTGIMKDGVVYTVRTTPSYDGDQITLGDIMETGDVDKQYFISQNKLYYTDPSITHSDETRGKLPEEDRKTWQYLKGAKKIRRKSSNGHEYVFSEGAIPMLDQYDKPARTMLTSEGNFSRTTHLVRDKATGDIRLLTAAETERIQGFPTDFTKYCLTDGQIVEMPVKKRRFMMGNALVVNLIADMEKTLSDIFDREGRKIMCRGDHTFRKEELVKRFDCIVGKTLGELDDKGLFESAKGVKHQKGIVGDVIEQCVLGYEHDNKQAADLTIIDDGKEIRTELKATGIVQNKSKQFVAKEPMSITAVGVYDIADEEFETSHFWEKLEHMLIVYYHYASKQRVSTYGYRLFPVEGYEFHEHTDQDKETLRKDWECVHNLIIDIVSDYPGEKDDEWKKKVRDEYIKRHGELRQKLSYVDLVPKFPPRFRLKKPVVSTMVSKYFGQDLRELPETYNTISEVDSKCRELTEKHAGKTISQIAADLGIHYDINKSVKSLVEPIIVAMFGGDTKKLNRIEIFGKFGIIAKSIVMTAKGGRTEDTKLYQIDFEEMCRKTYVDEEEGEREYRFEDSDMYSYFADHEFLYVIFEEDVNSGKKKAYTLANNKFKGFKRLVFDEEFIYGPVKKAWEDTRDKILNDKLVDEKKFNKDGTERLNKNGEPQSSPNFIKASENDVFVRGSGRDSSLKNKTECVNSIKMLLQYVWVKGTTIVRELDKIPLL